MLITRDGEIAGLPAVTARDLMRMIRNYAASLGELAGVLDVSPAQARTLVARLEDEGYLRRVEPGAGRNLIYSHDEIEGGRQPEDLAYWETTVKGNALAKARIGRPMPKQKARELLEGLIARAIAVNADGRSLFTIERVEVFGSFADPERDEVGDVDVRVLFDRRVDGDEYVREALAAAKAAEDDGRRFSSHVERLGFIEREFQRLVRGRSPRLDIQFDAVGHERPLPDGVVTQVVYTRLTEPEQDLSTTAG